MAGSTNRDKTVFLVTVAKHHNPASRHQGGFGVCVQHLISGWRGSMRRRIHGKGHIFQLIPENKTLTALEACNLCF